MGPTGVAVVVLGVVIAALWAQARFADSRACGQWDFVLLPGTRQLFDEERDRLERLLESPQVAYEEALEVTGDSQRRVLRIGLGMLVRTAPSLLSLLKTMRELTGILAAMVPTPPLRPSDYRLGTTTLWAWITTVVHHFLTTTKDRFSFRVYALRRCVGSVVSYLVRERDDFDAARLGRIHDGWHDYMQLSRDTIESYRLLLMSVSAVPAGERAPRADGDHLPVRTGVRAGHGTGPVPPR